MGQSGRQGELRRDAQAHAHASVSRCLIILVVVFEGYGSMYHQPFQQHPSFPEA